MPGKFRLSDMELDFVSIVASGDDPLAQVVLAKASPEGGTLYVPNANAGESKGKKHKFVPGLKDVCASCKQPSADPKHMLTVRMNKSTEKTAPSSTLPSTKPSEGQKMPEIKKDDLDPEVLAYVEGLETEVTTLSAQVEKQETDIAGLQETVSKSTPIDSDAAEKAMLEKADPALRSLIEKQQVAVKEAQEIAKAERDARLDRDYLSKAQTMPMLTEETTTLAGVLRRASESLSKEDNAVLDTVLKAANQQIAKSNLFKSMGAGGAETTISKSVEAKAEEIRKANPTLTREQAEAQVYDENPDLLQQAMTGQEG